MTQQQRGKSKCPKCSRPTEKHVISDSDDRGYFSWRQCVCGWNNLSPTVARQLQHLRDIRHVR